MKVKWSFHDDIRQLIDSWLSSQWTGIHWLTSSRLLTSHQLRCCPDLYTRESTTFTGKRQISYFFLIYS